MNDELERIAQIVFSEMEDYNECEMDGANEFWQRFKSIAEEEL